MRHVTQAAMELVAPVAAEGVEAVAPALCEKGRGRQVRPRVPAHWSLPMGSREEAVRGLREPLPG